MNYYLLIYDRRRNRILDCKEFALDDREHALAVRGALILEHRENPDLEIVLLGANSFEDLKKTHSRYFKTVGQLAKQQKNTHRPDPAPTR